MTSVNTKQEALLDELLKLDPQVFFACNSSSIDFSGVAFHGGHS